MSGKDINPFADPNDVNPFADPSVVKQSQGWQSSMDDYNPFDGTQPKKQQSTYTPQPPAPYNPIEPVRAETQQAFQAKPFGGPSGMITTTQMQDELEKKAAVLERREETLTNAETGQRNNFPPLPKFCCVQPCFFHDINLEIPAASQKTCRLLFYLWQLYIFTLFVNLLSSLALFVTKGEYGGSTFGLSILYFIVNAPLSFCCWYRPIYKALQSDSSFSYMMYFFTAFLQIVFLIIMLVGIPGVSCGFINGGSHIKTNIGSASMCFISGILWTLCAVFEILILKKVHTSYRNSGASLQKAQGEFAHGIASNKQVQKTAFQAAKEGVSQY